MIRRAREVAHAKLSDEHGDSMVEALVAIFIAVLGATMLATMVMASVSVTAKSEHELSGALTAESNLYDGGTPGKVAVLVPDTFNFDLSDCEVDVLLFSSGEYSAYSTDDQPAVSEEAGS